MAETVSQVSVHLENKPGRLAQVCTALAKRKINIGAVTVSDHKDRGVLRIVTDALTETRNVLKELSVPYDEQEVVLVEMRNQPGALAQVCEMLASEHVNIDYAYCGAGTRNGKTLGIFKVNNTPKCLMLLAESDGTRARRERHGGRGWIRSGARGKAVGKP
jgi:hypothetical protein